MNFPVSIAEIILASLINFLSLYVNKLLTNYLHFYHHHHCGRSLIWITAVVPELLVSLSPCLPTAFPHNPLHLFTWPPYCSHKTLNQIMSLSYSKFSKVFLSHLRKIHSLQMAFRALCNVAFILLFDFIASSLLQLHGTIC